MRSFLKNLLAIAAIITLPGFVLAQQPTGLVVNGYTDLKGAPLPAASDIRMTVKNDGKQTTITITGLQAFGEANVDKDGSAQRLARYSDKPDFFDGGTVYALNHGNKYRGGRTAASTKLNDDKGIMVLAKAAVGKDQVVLTFPNAKAEGDLYGCNTTSFLLVRRGGDKDTNLRHWLGHAGYATANNAPGIGDYLFLAQDDARFPGTGFCYDKAGQLVSLSTKRVKDGPTLRDELARIVQRPEGVGAAPAKAAAGG